MKLQIESDFQHKSLHCLVIPYELGHRCGYVGVPHNLGDAYDLGLDVHGGVTFEGSLLKNGLYYYGFDCAHSGDGKDLSLLTDEMRKVYEGLNLGYQGVLGQGVVRTKEYVENQCMYLADQLVKLVKVSQYKKQLVEEVLN